MALFLTLVNLFWGGQFRKCPLGVELGITASQDVSVILTVFTKVKTVTSHIDCMHQLSTVQMVHPATKKSYSPFYISGENFPIGFREITYKYFALVHLFDSCFSAYVSIMALFIWSVKSFWSGQFRKCPLGVLLGILHIYRECYIPITAYSYPSFTEMSFTLFCIEKEDFTTSKFVHPFSAMSYTLFYIEQVVSTFSIPNKYFVLIGSHLFDSCFYFDVTTIAVFSMVVQPLVDTLIIGTLDNIHPSSLCLVQVYQRMGFIG
jgi:hypothetical protein